MNVISGDQYFLNYSSQYGGTGLIFKARLDEINDLGKYFPDCGLRPIHLTKEEFLNYLKGKPITIDVDLRRPPVTKAELEERKSPLIFTGLLFGQITELEDISEETKKLREKMDKELRKYEAWLHPNVV